jgi:hypothetical protein
VVAYATTYRQGIDALGNVQTEKHQKLLTEEQQIDCQYVAAMPAGHLLASINLHNFYYLHFYV